MDIVEMLERLTTGQIALVKTKCVDQLKEKLEKRREVLTVQIPGEGEYIRFINGLASTLIQKARFRNRWDGVVLIDADEGGFGDRLIALLELLSLTTTGQWIICTKEGLTPVELRAIVRFGIPFSAGEYMAAGGTTENFKERIEEHAAHRGLTLRAGVADRLAEIAQEVQQSPVFSEEMLLDSVVVGVQQRIVTLKMVDSATGEGSYAELCRVSLEDVPRRSKRRTLGFTTEKSEKDRFIIDKEETDYAA